MGYILLDRPIEAVRHSADAAGWIAELDRLAEKFADDPDVLAQIRREREECVGILDVLREREAKGLEPVPDELPDVGPEDD